MVSREAKLFLNKCFKDGQIRVIKPTLDEKYEFPGEEKEIKFTESILNEIKNSERAQVRMVNEKTAIIQGILINETD